MAMGRKGKKKPKRKGKREKGKRFIRDLFCESQIFLNVTFSLSIHLSRLLCQQQERIRHHLILLLSAYSALYQRG